MNNQKVSIITPLFNSERFIKQTIDTVLQQSYEDFEFIIIDDNSKDKSAEIVEACTDKRIRLIRLSENIGAGAARNKGIREATGKYIAFLDSDDLWHKDKLKKQIEYMTSENISFCFSSFYLINDHGMNLGKYRKALPCVNYNKMLNNNYIGCLTAIYDCKVLGKVYMPERRKRQDWGLWLRLLAKTEFAHSLAEPLAYYRIRKDSLSAKKWNLLKSNYLFYKEYIGYTSIRSFIRMFLFLFYYFQYKIKYTKDIA